MYFIKIFIPIGFAIGFKNQSFQSTSQLTSQSYFGVPLHANTVEMGDFEVQS
jgi:hypothetical protein